MYEHKPFREVLEKSPGVGISINYSQHDNGWVALPSDRDDPGTIEPFFDQDEKEREAARGVLDILQIPWAVGETPEKALGLLMDKSVAVHRYKTDTGLLSAIRKASNFFSEVRCSFWLSFRDMSKEARTESLNKWTPE